MKTEVRKNWDWADQYLPDVENILRSNAMYLLDIQVAGKEKDTQEATDMIIRVDGGDVAVRLRRPYYDYRDLTIRAKSLGGGKTELTKIQSGFAKWYLYGWVSSGDRIDEYMLVDLDKVRDTDLLNDRDTIQNKDGTAFIAISYKELKDNGCVVASEVNND